MDAVTPATQMAEWTRGFNTLSQIYLRSLSLVTPGHKKIPRHDIVDCIESFFSKGVDQCSHVKIRHPYIWVDMAYITQNAVGFSPQAFEPRERPAEM